MTPLYNFLTFHNFLDAYRWQDGAIVANNPTIFAIREAQLLWPDTKIDCLVSIGCGSVPTKVSMDCLLSSKDIQNSYVDALVLISYSIHTNGYTNITDYLYCYDLAIPASNKADILLKHISFSQTLLLSLFSSRKHQEAECSNAT